MNQCRKGKDGEREAAAFLRSEGFDCRRGQQHCGGADSPDVIGIPGYHVEVKRVEKLNLRDATSQAEGDCGGKPWIVLHRWNHGQWLCTVKAAELLRLIRETMPVPTEAIVQRLKAAGLNVIENPEIFINRHD